MILFLFFAPSPFLPSPFLRLPKNQLQPMIDLQLILISRSHLNKLVFLLLLFFIPMSLSRILPICPLILFLCIYLWSFWMKNQFLCPRNNPFILSFLYRFLIMNWCHSRIIWSSSWRRWIMTMLFLISITSSSNNWLPWWKKRFY